MRILGSCHRRTRRLKSRKQNDKGQLSINLKAGRYAVFASAQGFASAFQQVEISMPKGQAGEGQTVPVVLQVGKTFSPTVQIGAPDSLLLVADPYHSSVAISPTEFAAIPHVTVMFTTAIPTPPKPTPEFRSLHCLVKSMPRSARNFAEK